MVLAWQTVVKDALWPQLVVAEITYDAELPDGLFAFAPPPDAPSERGITELSARDWSIGEAQAVAPFTVLVPREIRRGWSEQVRYRDDSEVSRVGPEVDLRYLSTDDDKAVVLVQRAASAHTEPDLDDGWLKTATGTGIAHVRGGDREQVDSQLIVERQGTSVFMHSRTLDRDALIELSRRLTPASGDEPPAQALLVYMKWFSEERWCAGWLIGLHVEMARLDDPAYKWLVGQAGGWWWWPEGAHDVSLQAGSLADSTASVGSDKLDVCRPLSRD